MMPDYYLVIDPDSDDDDDMGICSFESADYDGYFEGDDECEFS